MQCVAYTCTVESSLFPCGPQDVQFPTCRGTLELSPGLAVLSPGLVTELSPGLVCLGAALTPAALVCGILTTKSLMHNVRNNDMALTASIACF